jgi:translation initiation factor IF-2
VVISGLDAAPLAGDTFNVVSDLSKAKAVAERRRSRLREQSLFRRAHVSLENFSDQIVAAGIKELPIILKADVQGSVEAVRDALAKLEQSVIGEDGNPKVRLPILHTAVGGISKSDVLLADASDAIIIGFNVVPDVRARRLAEKTGIQIRLYKIIYQITEEIKQAMEGLLAPLQEERRLGEAEVRQTFRISRIGTVAGCLVTDGLIRRTAQIKLIRDGIVIHEGRLATLRRVKDDIREANSGTECGIKIAGFDDIKVGDRIEAMETVEVKQTL